MADIAGSYSSNQSYNPKFNYSISYSEIGRSGSAVSYRFNVSFTKQNGWYGYDININWNIGGATGSKQIKSTADSSSGSTSFDVTCSTNAAGGTVSARIYTSSSSDGTHWQNSMDTGSRTANKSTFNTAPSISGTVVTSPSGIIQEYTSSIKVTAPTATDPNGNLSGYRCRVSINGGGYSEVYRGSSREFNYNCSGYGEGTTFKFAFDCYDSYGLWSGNVYSAVVTKNRFSGDNLSSSSSISYSDGNSSINFAYSGASNTNGNQSFTKTLACDGITVYNSTVGGNAAEVIIYRSGTVPKNPYIKFDDIKNKFAGASYKGALNFTLTTTNAYGTKRYSSKAINVNLQTNPNAVGSCNIATNANSTAYKTVASTSNKYFLPDGSNIIRVDWTAGSGKLGEAISYELYVAYGSGGWSKVASIGSGTLYYNHKVPKQTVSQAIKYKVRTITGYGKYSDRDTSAQTLHFYNAPSLTTGTITRGATTADVIVTIKSNSSIPNINTVGTWNCYNKGTTTSVVNGTLTVTQNAQTIKVTKLTDAGQYDLKVTFKDDTGFSANVTTTIAIGANSPIFFVNKYGVGVNGVKATSTASLNVKGSIGLTDGSFAGVGGIFTYKGNSNGMGVAIQSGGSMVVGSGESPRAFMATLPDVSVEHAYITSDSDINFVSNCQTIENRLTATLTASGDLKLPKSLILKGDNAEHQLVFEDSSSESRKAYFYNGNSTSTTVVGLYDLTKAGVVWRYVTDNKLHVDKVLSANAGLQQDGNVILNGSDTWLRTHGSTGWVNETHKGGWNMTDANWIRSYGSKNVYIDRMLRADGGLEVGAGVKVVSSGVDGKARWVRFYDGTQICWGEHVHSSGDINMTGLSAGPAVYGGQNVNIYFPVTFTTKPAVSVVANTNGYTNAQGTGVATNLFLARAWNNYSTTPSHLYFSWIAIGRWK